MLPSRRQPVGWAAVMAVVLLWASLTAAQGLISVDYCSTINTATTPGNYSDFQSQGLCTEFCKQKRFGLAIVKEKNCWCSSILPSESIQVPTSRCRNSCPGFPPDVCGGDKTFGYMRINSNPITATAAGGSQDQTTAANPGTTGKPTPSVETVTVDGTVKTVTAPAAPDGSDSSSAQSNTKQEPGGNGGALGAGAIAGIVIGILAIFAIGAIAGFLVMRRKKRKEEEAYEGPTSPRGSGAAMAHVPRSPDGGDGFGSRPGGRRPTNGTYGSDHSSGRRSSMLMPSDPRMNPTPGIYGRADLNKSHDSFLTIQDNRDYSRPVHEPAKVLKVTNASPDDMD